MNDTLDPKVKVSDALKVAGGNQAELGRNIGVKRAWINRCVITEREFLPPLLAHRFVRVYGEPK